jgi:hypothetical protein
MNDTLSAILHSRKTRYATLDAQLLPHVPSRKGSFDSEPPTADVFVDIQSVYSSLWREDMREFLGAIRPPEFWMLSGELMNTIAHWRHWFWSRRGYATNVWLYHSSEVSTEMTDVDPNYRASWYDKRVLEANLEWSQTRKLVRKNIRIAQALCEYIPYVYCVDSGSLPPEAVPHLLGGMGCPVVVVSNEPHAALACLDPDRDVSLVTARGERSSVTRYGGVIASMSDAKGMPTGISDSLSSWVMAASGCKKLGVEAARKGFGPCRAAKLVYDWTADGKVSGGTGTWGGDPGHMMAAALAFGWSDVEAATLVRNHWLLDPISKSMGATDADVARLRDQMLDRYDPESLKRVNEKYYESAFLSLDWLFEGTAAS